MSTNLLAVLIVAPTAAVVIAIFLVLWLSGPPPVADRGRQRGVLAVWAIVMTMLAPRGFFEQSDPTSLPPIGITLALVLLALALCLLVFPSVASPSHESKTG